MTFTHRIDEIGTLKIIKQEERRLTEIRRKGSIEKRQITLI